MDGGSHGNILDNAVKYTDWGSITVRTKQYELFTAVEVEDTGRGLDEEEIPLVFQRFRRGEETQDQDGRGDRSVSGERDSGGRRRIYQDLLGKRRGSVFSVFLPNRIKENLQNCHN